MWYVYLNREQQYLRSYRTHNLWLDQYQNKIRTPRVTPFHLNIMRRISKTYSGVSYQQMRLILIMCLDQMGVHDLRSHLFLSVEGCI
jgi:hypothetical protein